MAQATSRRGWCPGALRPMETGDGLLVRVKPRCGTLSLDQAALLADLAARFGNGHMSLTSRGNIQLRGLSQNGLDSVTNALHAAGLSDDSAQAEAVRNIIVSPTAGFDEHDVRSEANTLEMALLAKSDKLQELPGKFCFLFDVSSSAVPLKGVEADVRFIWNNGAYTAGLACGGSLIWAGPCATADVATVGCALADGYLRHAGPEARRMRHLDSETIHTLIQEAGLGLSEAPPAVPPNGASRSIGIVRDRSGSTLAAGCGAPFGGLTAPSLSMLAEQAKAAGVSELRLTPWRAILLPVSEQAQADALLDAASAAGFITDTADPRRAIDACPGAPACASATTPVPADAARLAAALKDVLAEGRSLHVSGCAKGCARRQKADATLIGRNGSYGLVVNGCAADEPRDWYTLDGACQVLASVLSGMTKPAPDGTSDPRVPADKGAE